MSGNILINVPFSNFFNIIKPFTIGFDPMFEQFNQMLDLPEFTGKYPAYKIIKKNETNYSIKIDISNFKKKDIKIKTTKNFLTIFGNYKKTKKKDAKIEKKEFKRSFVFTDNFRVKEARVKNKILQIDLISRVLKLKKEEPNLIKIQ